MALDDAVPMDFERTPKFTSLDDAWRFFWREQLKRAEVQGFPRWEMLRIKSEMRRAWFSGVSAMLLIDDRLAAEAVWQGKMHEAMEAKREMREEIKQFAMDVQAGLVDDDGLAL